MTLVVAVASQFYRNQQPAPVAWPSSNFAARQAHYLVFAACSVPSSKLGLNERQNVSEQVAHAVSEIILLAQKRWRLGRCQTMAIAAMAQTRACSLEQRFVASQRPEFKTVKEGASSDSGGSGFT